VRYYKLADDECAKSRYFYSPYVCLRWRRSRSNFVTATMLILWEKTIYTAMVGQSDGERLNNKYSRLTQYL